MHRGWNYLVLGSLALAIALAGNSRVLAQDAAGEEREAKARAAAAAAADAAARAAKLEQIKKEGGAAPAADVPAAQTPPKPGDPAATAPEETTTATPAAPVNPKIIQLYLQDGTVITGEMAINEISVETEFGTLKVPLTKVRTLLPGLTSSPELSGRVNGLIEALGSDDYKAREQSHKDLAAMGIKVKNLLDAKKNDENAERKRHIGEILKEMEEAISAQEQAIEAGVAVDSPWIAKDTVVTGEFTIVGKVSPAEFMVESKYGPLKVNLADLRRAERPTAAKEAIRKTVNVPGDTIVQRSFKNSGIKVEVGDKVTLVADGRVVMSPWGTDQSSGPDGAANFGWYVPNQIPGGALVAKIGDRGTVFKVGSKHTFVAKQSGILNFAMAVQQQYSQQGYAWPGQYNVKVTIEPK